MFTKVMARIGKAAALGLVVTVIGLGFFGGGGSAHAMDNGNGVGAGCTYAGLDYSDGSIIRQADGALYRCKDGSWVMECAGCVTGANATIGGLTQGGGNQTPKGSILAQQGGIQKLQTAR